MKRIRKRILATSIAALTLISTVSIGPVNILAVDESSSAGPVAEDIAPEAAAEEYEEAFSEGPGEMAEEYSGDSSEDYSEGNSEEHQEDGTGEYSESDSGEDSEEYSSEETGTAEEEDALNNSGKEAAANPKNAEKAKPPVSPIIGRDNRSGSGNGTGIAGESAEGEYINEGETELYEVPLSEEEMEFFRNRQERNKESDVRSENSVGNENVAGEEGSAEGETHADEGRAPGEGGSGEGEAHADEGRAPEEGGSAEGEAPADGEPAPGEGSSSGGTTDAGAESSADGESAAEGDISADEKTSETGENSEEPAPEKKPTGISKTHIHRYDPITRTIIIHEATGHYEIVEAGTDIDTEAGDWCDFIEDWNTVCKVYESTDGKEWVFKGYKHPVYEEVWVEEEPETTETLTEYVCSACGETHSKRPVNLASGTILRIPNVVVNGTTLKEGRDYVLSRTKDAKKGTETITVYGRGHYQGILSRTFSILNGGNSSGSKKQNFVTLIHTGRSLRFNPADLVNEILLSLKNERTGSGNTTIGQIASAVFGKKVSTGVGTGPSAVFGKRILLGSFSTAFQARTSSIEEASVSIAHQEYVYTGTYRRPHVTVELNGDLLKAGRDYSLKYTDNKNVGTAYITVIGKNLYSGTKTITFKLVEEKLVPVYRLYNKNTSEHFYTASVSERKKYAADGWKMEGIAWYSPSISSQPIYRLANPASNEHFYTKNVSEKEFLTSLGWKDEGIAFYSKTSGGVPVYRLYHPSNEMGNHHYTTSKYERDFISTRQRWKQEGISWYVSKVG